LTVILLGFPCGSNTTMAIQPPYEPDISSHSSWHRRRYSENGLFSNCTLHEYWCTEDEVKLCECCM